MRAAQGGETDEQAVAIAPRSTVFVGPAIAQLVRLRYQCPFGVGGNGTLRIMNASSGVANLFVDSGGANPDYFQLGARRLRGLPGGGRWRVVRHPDAGRPGVALVSAASVHRSASNDCHVQAFGSVAG